ncbi:MAG: hypothetical protein JWM77_3416 [Rhodospirillales bacterium]|nr:hypothetical protein [Rhodospirillales bacterium]
MKRLVRPLTLVTAALWIAFAVVRQWCLTTTEPFTGSVAYLEDGVTYQVSEFEWNALVWISVAGAVSFVVTLGVWAVSVAINRRRGRDRPRKDQTSY